LKLSLSPHSFDLDLEKGHIQSERDRNERQRRE